MKKTTCEEKAKTPPSDEAIYERRKKAIREASIIMKEFNSILFSDAADKWDVTAKIATFLLSGAYRL